jgi:hemerythrin
MICCIKVSKQEGIVSPWADQWHACGGLLSGFFDNYKRGSFMAVIKWRDSYNIGVEQFDQEHHRIVELINLMFEAVRDKSGKEVVEKVCQDVLSYTEYHFANEEQALRAINYPDLEEQVTEHAKLRTEAKRLQEIIQARFPEGSVELYHFLREWLIQHILDSDKKYGSYLQQAPSPQGTAT